jgi:hypothetical protein
MKKIYLLATLIIVAVVLQAQSVLHYEFTSSLEEVNGNGPEMTVLGNAGIYEENTLDEVGSAQKWVYRFEKNSGFQFNNAAAGNFLGNEYTIEIYFVFDDLSSWKRVVDWKNRKTDYGAYVYYGELNFYPYIYSDVAPVVEDQYTYYVITREAQSEKLTIYTDAKIEIELTDTPGDALLDSDNVLNFFHDDLVVPNEASSGAVAMLKLYNYALDSNAIKDNYDNLAGNIFSIGEKKKENFPIQFFPNPANDQLNIDLSNFKDQESVTLKLVNSIGITVYQFETVGGFNQKFRLNTTELPSGIYMFVAESETKYASGKVMIKR